MFFWHYKVYVPIQIIIIRRFFALGCTIFINFELLSACLQLPFQQRSGYNLFYNLFV